MIIKREDIPKYLGDVADIEAVILQLRKIETMIRAYTHNDFVASGSWMTVSIEGGKPSAIPPLVEDGDTILIRNKLLSGVFTYRDGKLDDLPGLPMEARIGKVVYPEDVIQGALSMLQWDNSMAKKQGIKSESLSRYSVTYKDLSSGNSVMGYPLEVISFLQPYMKART